MPGLESHGPGSQGPGSQDPGSQGPGFQVLILDYVQVRPLPLPDFSCILKKKSEFHFVTVVLCLMFKYYR